MTSPAAGPAPRPAAVRALPIRPRPAAGDTPATYIRRLARANHLRPAYLNRYLRDDATGQPSIDMLAALAARPASSLTHAFSQDAPARRRYLTGSRRQELFEAIRRDARTRHRSIRALADDYGLHRRVIRQAIAAQAPRPRKPRRPSRPRPSRLDPYTAIIDAILDEDLRCPEPSGQ